MLTFQKIDFGALTRERLSRERQRALQAPPNAAQAPLQSMPQKAASAIAWS
jgi:hypothetical protein